MKENYIEKIEEAVTGSQLTQAIVDAFLAVDVSRISVGEVASFATVTRSEHDNIPSPTPDDVLYFITDG